MAAGTRHKFATMLYNNNTPKIFIVLIYTLLEWALIALLLLDGLFAYAIAAFAEFFGLDPPCFLCSHALRTCPPYREILCATHADEIARASRTCKDCSSSEPMAVTEEEGVDRCSKHLNFDEKTLEKLDLCEKSQNDENPQEKLHFYEEEALELVNNPVIVTQEGADCDLTEDSEEFGNFQQAAHEEEETIHDPLVENVANVGDAEEERAPETPTSIDNYQALHKRLLFERREFGSMSLDVNVSSDIDGSDIDLLKSALKAERVALSALYTELEEERNASAIAANQTMAMITRLQEEKAAMQMEAVHYQRMMEEQSEYDQDALQLLNELLMKREEELEMYRKKVIELEAKERRNVAIRSTSSGSSSADESNNDLTSEDFDYSHDDALNFGTIQVATENILALDDSFTDYEEEKLSILEQLKALEEKLFSLEDNDSDFPEQNGDFEVNGFINVSDSHNPRSMIGCGKKLLPQFDAVVSTDSEDGSPESLSKSTNAKIAIAEEMDSVYERLEALEADREFIKHCLESLKKGDKGMDLLQEILQHLRDLRSVQVRTRNAGYAHTSLSA